MVKIAFLDSGLGGIPYLLDLHKVRADISLGYVADNLHFPYGEKSSGEVVQFALEATKKVVNALNPSVIVVACNTISVTALEKLRKEYPAVKFVGTVPAIKPAASATKTGCIGLLATKHTIEDSYTKDLISKFAANCKLFYRADASLISFIEHKLIGATKEEVKDALTPMLDYFTTNNCDVIVLACTHFLNIASEIKEFAGSKITVLDSVAGVTRQALTLYDKITFNKLKEEGAEGGSIKVYMTLRGNKKAESSYKMVCKKNKLSYEGVLE